MFDRSVTLIAASLLAAGTVAAAPLKAGENGDRPPVTVEQVPADRRADADPDVPARMRDPDCRSADARTAQTAADFYGLPVIRDTRENGERLIPGVTVRPGGPRSRCR